MSSKKSPNNPPSVSPTPRLFGITGGIGSGKSHICRHIEAAGYPVFYCDAEAKRIIRTNAEVKEQLKQLVGAEVYSADGTLQKPVLAAYICHSKAQAAQVDAIVHPEVAKTFVTWAAQQTATKIFMECALLFESGFDRLVHRSILVSAPFEKRIARVMQRDGVSQAKAEEWIALQMPEEEKARRAHYIIYNEYTPDFQESLCAFLEDRIKI